MITLQILLIIINVLILTGFGQYSHHQGRKQSLMLTIDKWIYSNSSSLPLTFSRMILSGQYIASAFSVLLLTSTVFLEYIHLKRGKNPRFLCMCFSFGSVPFSLFVFGIELHYSSCPWMEDFYRSEVLRRGVDVIDNDAQCGINGWALAGVFSLLSGGFFVSEGLINAFFRSEHKRFVKCDETHL
ncbi:unnamed protein product [Enterobius vermicularis]|uniref:Uncharacterized protein n=1 Tax=Enterobius vermicularis TaxID=51028 RepID=A0A0N4VKF2_ENTVE|nr:unnamed protein product [Enterobius vermicularis]